MWYSENSSNEDLLWIYGHVISLAYSIESWFLNNSTIWLTWEWWNWKSTIMWLTKNLIEWKKEYDAKYRIININPWEYNENIDFFDILLKNLFIGYRKIFINFLKNNLEKILNIMFIIIGSSPVD